VQLITGVDVEPAHASDQDALVPMLDQLAEPDRTPETMYTDTAYGRDENVVEADRRGVDLQSPVAGQSSQNPDDLTVDDFVIDETAETVERCPAGCEPASSVHDAENGRTRTVMRASDCGSCAFRSQCPVRLSGGRYVLDHTPRQRRVASRRAEQRCDAFADHYRIRSGGESVNSGLKRRTGMGRLRTRGHPRIRMAILFRCAGWNIFRALSALKRRGIRDFAALLAALRRMARHLRRWQEPFGALPAAQRPPDRRSALAAIRVAP